MREKGSDHRFRQLISLADKVSRGDYEEVGRIFELTKSGVYPREIVELAEAFGMMIVKVEAEKEELEDLVEKLRREKEALERTSKELSRANIGMLAVLGNAIAKRDSDTNLHNYRVTLYATRLAQALGVSEEVMRGFIKGAFLHDVGKIGIHDNILLKPGRLTKEEFQIMQHHVQYGVEIIGGYEWLQDSLDIVLGHHEKYDGTGYVSGLKGDGIPLGARIFCIADVFDALTSWRPYKDPYQFQASLEIMKQDEGTHFDPEILRDFFAMAEEMFLEVHREEEEYLREMVDSLIREYFGKDSVKIFGLSS